MSEDERWDLEVYGFSAVHVDVGGKRTTIPVGEWFLSEEPSPIIDSPPDFTTEPIIYPFLTEEAFNRVCEKLKGLPPMPKITHVRVNADGTWSFVAEERRTE